MGICLSEWDVDRKPAALVRGPVGFGTARRGALRIIVSPGEVIFASTWSQGTRYWTPGRPILFSFEALGPPHSSQLGKRIFEPLVPGIQFEARFQDRPGRWGVPLEE